MLMLMQSKFELHFIYSCLMMTLWELKHVAFYKVKYCFYNKR